VCLVLLAILAYVENGILERIAFLNHMLLQSWEKVLQKLLKCLKVTVGE